MFKESGTCLFPNKTRLRHDHNRNKALWKTESSVKYILQMAPNENVGFSVKVEFALEQHCQSLAVDEKLVTRGSIHGHFLHGGLVSGRMGGRFIQKYLLSRNVEIMENMIFVINGVVTRDFGVLRTAFDAELHDLPV